MIVSFMERRHLRGYKPSVYTYQVQWPRTASQWLSEPPTYQLYLEGKQKAKVKHYVDQVSKLKQTDSQKPQFNCSHPG